MEVHLDVSRVVDYGIDHGEEGTGFDPLIHRSEERRVGKEC